MMYEVMFRVGIVDDGNMLCLSSFLHKMCKAQLIVVDIDLSRRPCDPCHYEWVLHRFVSSAPY